ncbi:MAG: cbb3-type cytochrome c oxidase subunit II [Myxococcota bacterium]|nr:cbb3-type cytochrome c oxidase subunit II [Myxococcota bacterium]
MIHMNAKVVGIGTSLLVALIFVLVVVAPTYTNPESHVQSANYRPRTEQEERGREIYITHGCQYCHSQYIRTVDWGLGAERLAEAGDYAGETAPQLGSIRNGPDLSQQGGEHTNDWHAAHFYNPRWTRPESFMPPFPYFTDQERQEITAYVQSLGGKMADFRMARQYKWRDPAIAAYESGVDKNIEWLHRHVPEGWLNVPNPYPITEVSRLRGATVYQRHCLGCHGPVGDGQGPAVAFIYPPPFNFTTLRRHGLEGGATGGMLYYQIMNGITGTAMPYFKRELESEKIWDVSNYVAEQFIGLVDANTEPRGIDAAFEPPVPVKGE